MGDLTVFTMQEVAHMVGVLSSLDPKDWPKPAAKAIINKAKDAVSDPSNRIRVVADG